MSEGEVKGKKEKQKQARVVQGGQTPSANIQRPSQPSHPRMHSRCIKLRLQLRLFDFDFFGEKATTTVFLIRFSADNS